MSIASKVRQEIKNDPSKLRSKVKIDQEYTFHAVQYGHKARVNNQLRKEMEDHLRELEKLNAEGMLLPPEENVPQDAQVKLTPTGSEQVNASNTQELG